MKHTEAWETCDQCGKIVKETRLALGIESGRIDLGEKRMNLAKFMGIYHWVNTVWLKTDQVLCSVSCAKKAFTKIIREYMQAIDGKVDDLSTDLWGGAGPDCSTVPA